MPTEATPSRGTLLYIADSSGVYEDDPVAQLRDIPIPASIREKIDVSNQDSAESRREYIAGWADQDDIEIPMVFKGAVWTYLKALEGKKRWMRICFPRRNADTVATSEATRYDGTPPHSKPYVQFIGCILGIGGESPYEDALSATVTIAVSGGVTFVEQDAEVSDFPAEPSD